MSDAEIQVGSGFICLIYIILLLIYHGSKTFATITLAELIVTFFIAVIIGIIIVIIVVIFLAIVVDN